MRMLQTLPGYNSFIREMNRVHRDLQNAMGSSVINSYPAINMWEDDNHLYIESELPGYQQSDLQIFITGEVQLMLKGERKPVLMDNAVCHRQERSFGSFERTLSLPVKVDASQVKATFTNGVLTLVLAKSAAAKPQKIEITVN